jgi:large subunit ribosomal protein L22
MAAVETPRKDVRAEARYVRTAPRKAQLVAEQIRGRSVPEARTILAFLTRDAARDVEKVLRSAIANAEANHGLDGDELYVSSAFVGSGPTLKRWRARARGRVARIKKRTCHITITLALPSGEEIPAPRAAVVAPAPAQPAAPEEAAKPKRAPRRKPAAEPAEVVEPPAEEEAQADVAEASPTAAPAKEAPRKRAPRTKAGAPEAPAEEKPKRKPAVRKAGGATPTTGEAAPKKAARPRRASPQTETPAEEEGDS